MHKFLKTSLLFSSVSLSGVKAEFASATSNRAHKYHKLPCPNSRFNSLSLNSLSFSGVGAGFATATGQNGARSSGANGGWPGGASGGSGFGNNKMGGGSGGGNVSQGMQILLIEIKEIKLCILLLIDISDIRLAYHLLQSTNDRNIPKQVHPAVSSLLNWWNRQNEADAILLMKVNKIKLVFRKVQQLTEKYQGRHADVPLAINSLLYWHNYKKASWCTRYKQTV